jgi:hypothetical protein
MCPYFIAITYDSNKITPVDNRLRELAMRRSSVVITIALAITVAASHAEAKLDLYVDKSTQRISVVQNGSLIYVWPVSTGRDNYSTPSGIYAPERLERSWFSKAYYNAPMPHAIFFHNGYAIHGSYDITRLGGPASHGCVRLHPQAAAMLFAMVEQEGPGNTTIVIVGDGPPDPRAPRYRDMTDQFRSANFGDGGFARGGYPPAPRMAPNYDIDRYAETAGRRRGDTGPFAARGADPVNRMDGPFRSADLGDGGMARGAYPPGPRMLPHYDTDRYVDAAGRRRGDAGPPATRGANPVNRPPAPRRDAATPVEPAIGPRGGSRPVATIKSSSTCPSCPPNREPDGAANHHVNSSETVKSPTPPEPQQPSNGYKILPKSYWAGASWRWRSKSDQEAK